MKITLLNSLLSPDVSGPELWRTRSYKPICNYCMAKTTAGIIVIRFLLDSNSAYSEIKNDFATWIRDRIRINALVITKLEGIHKCSEIETGCAFVHTKSHHDLIYSYLLHLNHAGVAYVFAIYHDLLCYQFVGSGRVSGVFVSFKERMGMAIAARMRRCFMGGRKYGLGGEE